MDKVKNFLSLSSSPAYTITGTYSYYLEVSIKGDTPYQTSTISITAFAKSDKKIAIAVSCKWHRVHEDRQYLLATIHSNTYQLSAEDLGYILKIEITPLEEDQQGTAIVQYGPIRLDPNVRTTLENILGAGGSRFPIQLVDEETGIISREPAALSITSDFIRVVETPPIGKEKEAKFRYNYDIPKVELNYLDGARLYFLFTGEEEDCEDVRKFLGIKKGAGCKLGLKFLSRTARDLIILTLKCFATKNYLIHSMLINEVVFTPGKIFKDKKDGPQQVGDMLLEVDSIKREMYLVLLRNQELGKDKERLQQSVKRLEEELSSTIETYSQLINEVRSNSDESQTTEAAGEYRRRAEKSEQEVKRLRLRIHELEEAKLHGERMSSRNKSRDSIRERDEMAKIRQDFESLSMRKAEENLFSLEYEMKVHDLQEENEKLRAQNKNLIEELRQVKGMGTSSFQETAKMTRGRGTVHDESLFVIESKISDTKRLNELLIKQVNDLKAKNGSMQKELDMLRNEMSKLQNSETGVQNEKERSHREAIEALQREINKLKTENLNLQKEKASQSLSGSFIGKDRSNEENFHLMRRIEELQRENNDLKARISSLEKGHLQINDAPRGSARDHSILNMSQSGMSPIGTPGTPIKRRGEEEFANRFKVEMEMLGRDAMNLKARCTDLEMELERLRKENIELKTKTSQLEAQRGYSANTSVLASPGRNDVMSYLDKSMMNTSRTYENLLGESKKENDRLFGEIITLKPKLTLLEHNYQIAQGEIERLRNAGNMSMTMENDAIKLKREIEGLKEVNERLKTELNLLRVPGIQMNQQERDNLYKERDHMKKEIESLRKLKTDLAEREMTISDLQRNLNDKLREIKLLQTEAENYKAKNLSLQKEIEYLRSEVNTLRKKDESILNLSGFLGKDNEYKGKYERLQEDYNRLETEYNTLRKTIGGMRKESIEGLQDAHQMNELLRKEILEYKRRVEELESGRKSFRNSGIMGENPVDEELKKRNRMLEVEVQNQRLRISELEKENERHRLVGSRWESTSDNSFIGRDRADEKENLGKVKEEVERLSRDNESLIQQRNQLSKKVESLAKELENKTGAKTNQAMLENLAKTNGRLVQENASLMDQIQTLRDEIDTLKYGRLDNSRLDDSRYEGENDHILRQRFNDMQNEISMVKHEKDQLLVELSKMKAIEKNKFLI